MSLPVNAPHFLFLPKFQSPGLHQEVLAISFPAFHGAVILYVPQPFKPQRSLGRTELPHSRHVRTWQDTGVSPPTDPIPSKAGDVVQETQRLLSPQRGSCSIESTCHLALPGARAGFLNALI